MLLASLSTQATDSTWRYAVQVTASVQASPPQITLNWVADTASSASSYVVFRKAADDTSWGSGTVLPGNATSFVDDGVVAGAAYEYQIQETAPDHFGYGYIYAGINAPLTEQRGKILLVVDNTYAANLAFELGRLQQDLVGDGWTVIRLDVSRNDTVENIKAGITGQYWSDSANVNTVFLFGHVPVPYSGDIAPDEHSDHRGAWPADVYYGNLYGTWTDQSVNDSHATDTRNRNVPGDGKFDQSSIPSGVQLMVGRVDLANLPGQQTWNGPATFPAEVDLLRQYLNKDHNFRTAEWSMPRRGLIYDGFGDFGGEAFSASGWRNFAPMFGPQNITFLPGAGTWLNTLHNNAYLCAYGCGSGVYNGIFGIGNSGAYAEATTPDLVQADPQAVFLMLFGSYLGDWDTLDNFQRAALATPTFSLVCCWSGSPHWYCHHMVLGQTIGYSTRVTQNNTPTGLYRNQTNGYAGLVHVALMGDPTLRMHPVGPIANLSAGTNANGVQLNWSGSFDTVLGYYVYRSSDPAGPFTRLTSSLVNGTSLLDTAPLGGANNYMVRAIKLENTPSGTYFNASQGVFATINWAPLPGRTQVRINWVKSTPPGIAMGWTSVAGDHYRVAGSTNMNASVWLDLTSDIVAPGTSLSWTDQTSHATSERFYRVFDLH